MGSVSSALCSMVANLTTGKKKYAEYQGDIERILKDTAVLTDKIADLMQKDADAFEPLAKAYSIPKEEPDRDELLENALKVASDAPFEIVETMNDVSLIIEELAVKGSRLAISDVGVAAAACRAAVCGASMNVYINTKLMKDRTVAEEYNRKADGMLAKYVPLADEIYSYVLEQLRKP